MALYLGSLGNRSVLINTGGKHFKAFNFEDAFLHKIEGKLLKKHSQSWNETTYSSPLSKFVVCGEFI